MGPLAFVNWSSVNRRFCAFMWMAAIVLAMIVLVHIGNPHPAAPHHGAVIAH